MLRHDDGVNLSPNPDAAVPFDPFDLDRVRQQVVEPIVAALLHPGELDDLQVTWTTPQRLLHLEQYRGQRHQEDLFVLVTARGEEFYDILWHPDWGIETTAAVGRRLADHLEDWVCETRFAWGERRLVPESMLIALPET